MVYPVPTKIKTTTCKLEGFLFAHDSNGIDLPSLEVQPGLYFEEKGGLQTPQRTYQANYEMAKDC